MDSGLYLALSGSITAMKKLDVISNNLANVQTPGYKKDGMAFDAVLNAATAAPPPPPGAEPGLLADVRFYTDFTPGPVKQTGNSLDLSLEGSGFFVVNTPNGPAYTRQGNFKLDASGKMVTTDGFEVLAGGRPVTLAGGGTVSIDDQGRISRNGAQVGTLDVVDFPQPYQLSKTEAAMFVPAQGVAPQPAKATVRQGYLEESNVSTVREMVEMIETNRYFELCQKAVRSYDDTVALVVNKYGQL